MTINLNQRFKMHHLDLMTIPNSVEKLRMEGNNLQSISHWKDLKGKSLQSLLLCTRGHDGNGDLMLNLTEFSNPEIKNPLKHLRVSRGHIAAYFRIKGTLNHRAVSRIRIWTNGSTLDSLRILKGHYSFVFYNDGRVMFSKKEGENRVFFESYFDKHN